MDRDYIKTACLQASNLFIYMSPKRTGHMAFNATRTKWVNKNHFKIYIDKNIIENVGPLIYAKNGKTKRGKPAKHYYPRTINEKPNYRTYGWVEKGARQVAEFINNKLGGTVK